jgi:hypothetical protein
MFSCIGSGAAIWWADPPSKKSYRLPTRFTVSELTLNGNRPGSLVRQGKRGRKRRRVLFMKRLLCSFLQPLIISSLFGPGVLVSTLFSNILSLCSSINEKIAIDEYETVSS